MNEKKIQGGRKVNGRKERKNGDKREERGIVKRERVVEGEYMSKKYRPLLNWEKVNNEHTREKCSHQTSNQRIRGSGVAHNTINITFLPRVFPINSRFFTGLTNKCHMGFCRGFAESTTDSARRIYAMNASVFCEDFAQKFGLEIMEAFSSKYQ